MKKTIVWFKRDLRATDHEPLHSALAEGQVLPLYVAEPELWRQRDRSGRQWRETAAALAKLRMDLNAAGLPLAIMTGQAQEVLVAACRTVGADTVRAHRETGTSWTFERDKSVAKSLARIGVEFSESQSDGVARGSGKSVPGFLCEHPGADAQGKAIPFREDPIPEEGHLGIAPDLGGQEPSRKRAAEILESFCRACGSGTYRDGMWNASEGASASSRLSIAFAVGELSTDRALDTVARYEREASENRNATQLRELRQFRARINWRRSFMQSFERNIGIEPAQREVDASSADRFDAWARGLTGVPMIDATMRSLRETGWANFRMRHMAISFANHHLALDWSATGRQLARLFSDYEPGIHWCQLAMMAGTAGHPRPNVYDPVKQGRENDPEEDFVRAWVPELAGVPHGLGHEPWRFDASRAPIVDLRASRIAAIERMTGKPQRAKKPKDGLALLL